MPLRDISLALPKGVSLVVDGAQGAGLFRSICQRRESIITARRRIRGFSIRRAADLSQYAEKDLLRLLRAVPEARALTLISPITCPTSWKAEHCRHL